MKQSGEPKVIDYRIQFLIIVILFSCIIFFSGVHAYILSLWRSQLDRLVLVASNSNLYLGVGGAVIALIRRSLSIRRRGDKSFVFILVNDFSFDNYATLSLLSLIYAITQGICFGVATGYSFLIVVYLLRGGYDLLAPFVGLASSFLAIIAMRLLVEGYAVIYRTAQDAGNFFRNNEDNRNHNP